MYNFIESPSDDYKPRLADDRVGIYDDIYLDFSNDRGSLRLAARRRLRRLEANDIPLVSRNLQMDYLSKLLEVANTPAKDTPADAQSLARVELGRIAA